MLLLLCVYRGAWSSSSRRKTAADRKDRILLELYEYRTTVRHSPDALQPAALQRRCVRPSCFCCTRHSILPVYFSAGRCPCFYSSRVLFASGVCIYLRPVAACITEPGIMYIARVCSVGRTVPVPRAFSVGEPKYRNVGHRILRWYQAY